MIASASALIMWCGTTFSSRLNHQALICVSTAPFIGMVSAMTTSNALMRSVVSSSTRSSPTA
jgi:hypothetical protein